MHSVSDDRIRTAEQQAQALIQQAAMLESFGKALRQFSRETAPLGSMMETCGRAALQHGDESHRSAIAAQHTGSLREFDTATQAHRRQLEAAMDAVRTYGDVRDCSFNDSKCLAEDRA